MTNDDARTLSALTPSLSRNPGRGGDRSFAIRHSLLAIALPLVFVLVGCALQPAAPGTPTTPQQSARAQRLAGADALNPCANRLQEVSGLILQYYLLKKRLPESLADVASMQDADRFPLVCPASGKPYLYDIRGMAIEDMPGLVIVLDPEASHHGHRFAVTIDNSSGQPIADVIAIPEVAFGRPKAAQ